MKSVFKKIVGIALFFCVVGSYASGAKVSEDTMNSLTSLRGEERADRTLALFQKSFTELPVVLVVKTIPFLAEEKDKIYYSKQLLEKSDLFEDAWWSELVSVTTTTAGCDYEYRAGKNCGMISGWLARELLDCFPPQEKSDMAKTILDRYRDIGLFSENYYQIFVVFLINCLRLEEERARYIELYLQITKLPIFYDSFIAWNGLLDCVSVENRQRIAQDFLKKSFDDLHWAPACQFIEFLKEETERIEYGKRLLLRKKFGAKDDEKSESLGSYEVVSAVLNSVFTQNFTSQDNIQGFVTSFLVCDFNELSAELIIHLMTSQYVSYDVSKRIQYLQRLITEKKLTEINANCINALCPYIIPAGKSRGDNGRIAETLLEAFFEGLDANTILNLINKFPKDSTFADSRKKNVNRLVESGKLEISPWLEEILKKLDENERRYAVAVLRERPLEELRKEKKLSPINLFDFFSSEEKYVWLQKNNIFWHAFSSEDAQDTGPLFSKQFLRENTERAFSVLQSSWGIDKKLKQLQEMLPRITHFAKTHYKEGKVVFFHAQHDKWAFLAGIFDGLVAIKNNQLMPKDFVRLRFQIEPVLSLEQAREIRDHGVKDFENNWAYVLFTNLHLLSNGQGSNSLLYFLENYDQTTVQSRFDFDANIEAFFSELEMLPEYNELIKKQPTLFTDLYDLYKKDVVARGDIGRLIAIAMRPEVAQRLAYSTKSGASLNPLIIDGEATVDVTKIAQKFGEAPFNQEYVVIMDQTMTDSLEAAAVGTIMASFSSDTNAESVPLAREFKEKKTEAILWASFLHSRRTKPLGTYLTTYEPSFSFSLAGKTGLVKKAGINETLYALYLQNLQKI